jgi:hypothetical protein
MAIHDHEVRSAAEPIIKRLRFAEFGDTVSKPRDFAARRIPVHDVLLRCANNHRFGFGHSRERTRPVTRRDRFFNLSHRAAQTRAPRPIDCSTPRALPCGLLGRLCVGHNLKNNA